MLPQKAIKSKKKGKTPFWQQPSTEQLSQEYAADQAARKISQTETKKIKRKQGIQTSNEDPFSAREERKSFDKNEPKQSRNSAPPQKNYDK